MKKNLFSLLMPIFVIIGFSSNSFGSNPSNSFMTLPVSYFYANGLETVANKHSLLVTVSDLVKYGFQPGKKLWEKLESNQYIFTSITKDTFTGVSHTLKILFVPRNDQGVNRALMQRVIYNSREITNRAELTKTLEMFIYDAYEMKKIDENPNYLRDKEKKAEEAWKKAEEKRNNGIAESRRKSGYF